MHNIKLSTGNKLGLIVTLLICLVGIALSLYIPEKIFNESKTLAHTAVILNMMLLELAYNLSCITVLVIVIVACSICVIRKVFKRTLLIHMVTMIVVISCLAYLPRIAEPWNYYQFSGFIEGVKQNVDEHRLREWINTVISEIDAGSGKMYDRGELDFLSRTGKMKCEAQIEKNSDDLYEITMYWGGPIGHYGLYICSDKNKIDSMQKKYQIVEVYEGVYAWSDK